MVSQATAVAHPNIAVVKYWGKRDLALNLPAVSSLSVTLDTFCTRTTVTWGASTDHVVLDGRQVTGRAAERVSAFLDRVDPARPRCAVETENNFPTAAGLASSSSGFAALALAACAAAGRSADPTALSRLARQGSGSACRSLWGGWVRWPRGERTDGEDSHGVPIAPRQHWELSVVVALVASGPKAVGSTAGMLRTQRTSPLFAPWAAAAEDNVRVGCRAVQSRDLEALGAVMERSTQGMHATMLGADPPLRYWAPGTLAAMDRVERLRAAGVSAWHTSDAGPNLKVLCLAADAERVAHALREVTERVVVLGVGGDAGLVG